MTLETFQVPLQDLCQHLCLTSLVPLWRCGRAGFYSWPCGFHIMQCQNRSNLEVTYSNMDVGISHVFYSCAGARHNVMFFSCRKWLTSCHASFCLSFACVLLLLVLLVLLLLLLVLVLVVVVVVVVVVAGGNRAYCRIYVGP